MRSSKYLAALLFLVVACSDSKDVAGGTTEDAGIVAIENRIVSGVSQKGPFLAGASVTVQELDGHTMYQTGKSFRSNIRNDDGEFSVKGVNLVSQYALLEVNGYYRNEVTGKKSQGTIILNALTDLSNRDHVNVNLLTHLMAERILVLVQKKGLSFAEAKKQAEREVFDSFGILDGVGCSEDLDLFTGEGSAALMAISILMQGEGSEADLSERVARAAMSFADKGYWKGTDKSEMTDWAFQADVGLKTWLGLNIFVQVRKNILSWNNVDSVPDFEDALYRFWAHEYGLGECSEKNQYEVRVNTDSLSQYFGIEFLCDEGAREIFGEKYRWNLVRDRRYDLIVNFRLETDARDGKEYLAKEIGGAWWFGENLRYDDQNVSHVTACYEEKNANCDAYGMLYAANSAQGACPSGTRLPTYEEVQALIGDGEGSALQRLQALDGFRLLYGGWGEGLNFQDLHKVAAIWISSSSFDPEDARYLRIDSTHASVEKAPDGLMASIRCVIDQE